MKLHIPFHAQHTDFTCGPASLCMIFDHLGVHKTEDALARIAHTNTHSGTSHQHIIDCCKELALETMAFTHGTPDLIRTCLEAGYPVLINYQEHLAGGSHYAVVTGYETDSFIINDPYDGADLTLSIREFTDLWYHTTEHRGGWMLIIGREGINIHENPALAVKS